MSRFDFSSSFIIESCKNLASGGCLGYVEYYETLVRHLLPGIENYFRGTCAISILSDDLEMYTGQCGSLMSQTLKNLPFQEKSYDSSRSLNNYE